MDRNRGIGCGTLILLTAMLICCFLGAVSGLVEAAAPEKKCTTWVLMSPGYRTRSVSVMRGEGGYNIALADATLVIWKDGETTASARLGDYTYRGIVGISYPENYCAIMFQITEVIFVDYWTDMEDF